MASLEYNKYSIWKTIIFTKNKQLECPGARIVAPNKNKHLPALLQLNTLLTNHLIPAVESMHYAMRRRKAFCKLLLTLQGSPKICLLLCRVAPIVKALLNFPRKVK